jgi:hypothetical protein
MYASDTTSLALLESITKGLDFSIPDIDWDDPNLSVSADLLNALQEPSEKLTTETITERRVNGSGIFDGFMETFKVHLREEYNAGRITGAEYTKAYIALATVGMQTAVQFALGKDQAYWAGVQAQLAAITANINSIDAKVKLAIAQAQAHTNKANYALTVDKLASTDAEFELANKKIATEVAQCSLVKESVEATRAKTLDTRTDGATVKGESGKDKELKDKQIWAYERDAQQKVASIFSNAWITQKGIDEGLAAPSSLQNTYINETLIALNKNVGLK